MHIHPFVIMRISQHHTRSHDSDLQPNFVLGGLLGTKSNHDKLMMVMDSFELRLKTESVSPEHHIYSVDKEFFQEKLAQVEQVSGDLELLGWYATVPVNQNAQTDELFKNLHKQISELISNPIFLKLDLEDPKHNSKIGSSQLFQVFMSVISRELNRETINFIEIDWSIIPNDNVVNSSNQDSNMSNVQSKLSTQIDNLGMQYNEDHNTSCNDMNTHLGKSSDKQQRVDGTRGILNKLAVKYGRFKTSFSSSHQHKYPLGLMSASFSEGRSASAINSQGNGGGGGSSGDSSYVNPLKEKQRATLVNSTGEIGSSNNSSTTSSPTTNIDGANQKKIVSEFSKMVPPGSLNISTPSFNLKPHQMNSTSQTSRTTRRFNELRIEDPESNNQQEPATGGESSGDEPLVYWHPYAHSQSGGSSPHNCLRSCASSYDSDSFSDSHHFHDSTLILESDVTMAIAKEEANTMFVQRSTVLHNNHEEDYKMTAKPRGICLIVNNIDFDGDIFPTRTGSDIDAKRFDEVFTQLFFTVIMRRNLTAEQMKNTFKEVASKCKKEHDAFFVFILSHGSEHGIFGIDGIEVSLENDMISCFDNRNCKPLRGKPKVFVIQACRGRAIDYGGEGDMTDSIAASPVATSSPIVKTTSSQNRVPNSWLPNTRSQESKKREPPSRTDMLLVFSCLAGFVSVRNELWGSWLGVAFSYFLMKHAHEKDLLKILNFVTHDITQRKSAYGHVQSTEVKLLGWKKNLFFNPGL